MKLVEKPQFDVDAIEYGSPVRLYSDGKAKLSQTSKFSSGDYGLIITKEPLKIVVLLADKSQAMIYVQDVANEHITIKEMREIV